MHSNTPGRGMDAFHHGEALCYRGADMASPLLTRGMTPRKTSPT